MTELERLRAEVEDLAEGFDKEVAENDRLTRALTTARGRIAMLEAALRMSRDVILEYVPHPLFPGDSINLGTRAMVERAKAALDAAKEVLGKK